MAKMVQSYQDDRQCWPIRSKIKYEQAKTSFVGGREVAARRGRSTADFGVDILAAASGNEGWLGSAEPCRRCL